MKWKASSKKGKMSNDNIEIKGAETEFRRCKFGGKTDASIRVKYCDTSPESSDNTSPLNNTVKVLHRH